MATRGAGHAGETLTEPNSVSLSMISSKMSQEALGESMGAALGRELAIASWGSDVDDVDLFPAEAELVEVAVPERRREFARGRACLRAALGALGGPRIPILRGPGREPLMPSGFVGSVTHSGEAVVAVAALATWARGIGVDVEATGQMEAPVRQLIVQDDEHRRAARTLGRSEPDEAVTLLFSAKESVHKAIYPATARWLDFLDVEIELEPDAGGGVRDGTGRRGAFRVRSRDGEAAPGDLLGNLHGRYWIFPGGVTTFCRFVHRSW